MIKGKILFKGGHTKEGVFDFSAKFEGMGLKKGQITYGIECNLASENGLFEYIEELGGFSLVEGISIFKIGTIFEGKWQYIPQLKRMEVRFSRVFLAKRAFMNFFMHNSLWKGQSVGKMDPYGVGRGHMGKLEAKRIIILIKGRWFAENIKGK